ncbi:hypothetical protein BpHYR1_015317 [Brachionus plicatilis]|uniref:Uncharacterized protein n=1 Tax=Brachionus plicatilis TaxID=10195 RepID=A0A3M7QED7_BRAPC|nr:hypothetical protein BpHYR1_015317 [Brachionus plicatilis]
MNAILNIRLFIWNNRFILLKSFKLNLVLFSLLLQLNSIVLCSNEQIGLLSGVFLSIDVAPIFLNTLVEFIVYLHKFWKRFLIVLFCCEGYEENKNDTKKD